MCTGSRACRHSRTRSCLCAVLIIHLIIIASAAVALYLRFGVYGDLEYYDMPTDQRLLNRSEKSIFCSEHRVESRLEVKDDGQINTRMTFDLYSINSDPAHSPNVSFITASAKLTSTEALAVGAKKNLVYRLMARSVSTIQLCDYTPSSSNTTSMFWYCVTRGEDDRISVLSRLTTASHLCLTSRLAPLPPCSSGVNTSVTFTANTTDDYAYIFLNPSSNTGGIKFRADYLLHRQVYDLTRGFHLVKNGQTSLNINPTQYLLVNFPYYYNSSTNHLVKIELRYLCHPFINVYMAFFFWLPLVLMVIVALIALYRHNRTGEYTLLNQDDADSYGTLPR